MTATLADRWADTAGRRRASLIKAQVEAEVCASALRGGAPADMVADWLDRLAAQIAAALKQPTPGGEAE